MSILPKNIDLTGTNGIDKGRKFSAEFICVDTNGSPVNLSDYTVQADARTTPSRTAGAKILDFTVSHDDTGGTITLEYDDSAGGITANSGYYDIVLIDGSSNPDTWIYGKIDFNDRPTEVT